MVRRKQWVYGALSIVCPLIILGGVLIFQAISYPSAPLSDPPDDADIHSAVLMTFVVVFQLLVAMTVGCLLGLILAMKTLKLQKRWIGIGLIGLIFNGIPLVLLAAFWIRRW
jgi:hypothetical protein